MFKKLIIIIENNNNYYIFDVKITVALSGTFENEIITEMYIYY